MTAAPPRTRSARESGVASLVVVMVLFFIVSMVAAYTNRNLIFEQRTATNQYRSTQALEAAEAGLEWAKSMLNTGRLTSACLTTGAVGTDTSFRQRYLSIDSVTGVITPKLTTGSNAQLWPTCVYNGAGWTCDCPSNAAPSLTTSGTDIRPAFRVRFCTPYGATGPTAQAGIVRVEVNGCTSLDNGSNNSCLSFPTGSNYCGTNGSPPAAFSVSGMDSEGRATVTELLALASGLPSTPAAALTAGGNVALTASPNSMTLSNSDLASGGWTVQAGGSIDAASKSSLVLSSAPGTPASASLIENDGSLAPTADRMFAGVFDMWPDTYQQQPAALVLSVAAGNCSAGGCNAADVRTALAMNPDRVLWVDGTLAIDSAGDIGSATAPVVLVVAGDVTFSNVITIYGALYLHEASWTSAGTSTVQGALIAEGDVVGNGTLQVVYNPTVLQTLRNTSGSFVGAPGGWKDYP